MENMKCNKTVQIPLNVLHEKDLDSEFASFLLLPLGRIKNVYIRKLRPVAGFGRSGGVQFKM